MFATAPRLAKLQQLRRRGFRLVVVDGGSSTGTLDLARGHADIAFQSPRGRTVKMNASAVACRAEVRIFLHVETKLPEGADTLILDAIASRLRGGVSTCNPTRGPHLRLIAQLNLRSRLTGIATGDQTPFV